MARMRPLPTALALLGLGVGCAPAPGAPIARAPLASGDTGGAPARFDAGVLDDDHQHVNASWAGVALLDFDQDGWLDIFLPNGHNAPDALFRNLGDGHFADVAAAAGVASEAENGGALAADLDNDGDTDLFVLTVCTTGTWSASGNNLYDGGKLLYENLGDGTFRAVDLSALGDRVLGSCAVSATAGDVDSDGLLDILLSNGHDLDVAPPWIFNKNDPGAANTVLYNDGDLAFSQAWTGDSPATTFATALVDLDGDGPPEVVQAQGGAFLDVLVPEAGRRLRVARGASHAGEGLWMGIAALDVDRDGTLDLYTTNQGPSPYLVGYDNTYQQLGGAEATWTDEAGLEHSEWRALHPFHAVHLGGPDGLSAPAAVRLDAPGLLAGDLFEATMAEGGEAWAPAADLQRLAWGWGVVALDADADGWMDLFWTGNNASAPMDIVGDEARGAGPGGLLRSTGPLAFEDLTWTWGVANQDPETGYPDGRGVATGDLNNDGYADVVVTNRGYNPSLSDPLAQTPGRPRIWLSQPRDGHWLRVELVGTASPRDALGSTVWVVHDGERRVYAYGAGGGTNASSEPALSLGLGDWEEVTVEVRFPSGATATVEGVAADTTLVVEEPA